MSRLHLLGIAGSLRTASYNRRLLEWAARLAPPNIDLEVYSALAEVPLFNEDLETASFAMPRGVIRLRRAIEAADAILIATPEHNQSMPGVLKNAIDWASRPPKSSFSGKPVILMGSTVGEWGTRLSQAALRQTLGACGAELIQVPHLYLRHAATLWDEEGKLDEQCCKNLRSLLEAIDDRVRGGSGERSAAA